MLTPISRLIPIAAVAAAALLCPALAAADSIVYVKGGEVWTANADGSGARQFTTSPNAWHSPSEADDGTVVVAGGPAHGLGDAGSDLYRFTASGAQIGAPIPTPGTYYTPSCPTQAPSQVRVSFDASKIAYGSFLCATSEYTTYWTPSNSTGLNFPNQSLGQQDFYEPAWQDNSHFTVSHAGPTVTSDQARWFLHDVAGGDDTGVGGWSEPTMTGTGAQGLISRDGTTFAVFEDNAADNAGKPTKLHLWLYSTPSLAQAESSGWTKRCEIELDASHTSDPFHLSPSFSPDGSKLAWGDDNGVELLSIAGFQNGCPVGPSLLIPGGSQPYYAGGNAQRSASAAVARFKVKPKHPRAGRKATFDASGSSAGSYRWSFGDHKKASGRKVSHKYRKGGTYKVTLTVRTAAGASAKVTHKVKVRR